MRTRCARLLRRLAAKLDPSPSGIEVGRKWAEEILAREQHSKFLVGQLKTMEGEALRSLAIRAIVNRNDR